MRRVLVQSLHITVHGPAETAVLSPGTVVDLDRVLGTLHGRPFTVADGLSADVVGQLLASPAPPDAAPAALEETQAAAAPPPEAPAEGSAQSRRTSRRAAITTDTEKE